MSYSITALEPQILWQYFDKIREIPHGSGNEAAIRAAIVSWAQANGHDTNIDAVGNVVIRVSASPGCEAVPTLILQGHMDMVQEKRRGSAFDFDNDPITLVREGDWIKADGTTLGADNGIGLAAALSFMEMRDLPHGPLEILATTEEETGLSGAAALTSEFIKGRRLFNFDSEEDGILYVGCAGGSDAVVTLPINRIRPPKGSMGFRVEVSGLLGGHSGLDIIHNRSNAIILLARILRSFSFEMDLHLASIQGGEKHNAIPREASAILLTLPKDEEKMARLLSQRFDMVKGEFGLAEPAMNLAVTPEDPPPSILEPESRLKALGLALSLPNGVKSMMRDIPGVVETSSNLARIRTEENIVTLRCSSRSSVSPALDGLVEQIDAVAALAGARINVQSRYPGWKPNMSSRMLATARRVWQEVHAEEAAVHVVHAGLECGLIGERFQDMDMISLGPTIENAHSPDERVSISSVVRFHTFARAFVADLAKG